jgi:SOS-response transcriptional repressor LexA
MSYTTKLRIKELLRERRWTTKILAEKTGMSESYLTHIKNGTRRWNEDALRKLATAFEMDPTFLFDESKDRTDNVKTNIDIPESMKDGQASNINLKVKVVPVVGKIPAEPSEYNNQICQHETGYKDQFVPVEGIEYAGNSAMFCLAVEDSSMSPTFLKGDYIVIVPDVWTNSGDIVAIEYEKGDETIKEIGRINYMEEFVILESLGRKKAPVALVRGKDQFRIIGKVVCRYQKMV